jgi:hypothetical protein
MLYFHVKAWWHLLYAKTRNPYLMYKYNKLFVRSEYRLFKLVLGPHRTGIPLSFILHLMKIHQFKNYYGTRGRDVSWKLTTLSLFLLSVFLDLASQQNTQRAWSSP